MDATGEPERFYSEAFDAQAARLFEACDDDGNGVLKGYELREAVLQV